MQDREIAPGSGRMSCAGKGVFIVKAHKLWAFGFGHRKMVASGGPRPKRKRQRTRRRPAKIDVLPVPVPTSEHVVPTFEEVGTALYRFTPMA